MGNLHCARNNNNLEAFKLSLRKKKLCALSVVIASVIFGLPFGVLKAQRGAVNHNQYLHILCVQTSPCMLVFQLKTNTLI